MSVGAGILGLIGTLAGIGSTQAIAKRQEDIAREQIEQAERAFEAQQAELDRQIAKEERVSENNMSAISGAFGKSKKKKTLNDVFLPDYIQER